MAPIVKRRVASDRIALRRAAPRRIARYHIIQKSIYQSHHNSCHYYINKSLYQVKTIALYLIDTSPAVQYQLIISA